MRDLASRALNLAEVQGASYADIRIVHQVHQSLIVRNGTVENVALKENLGFGVRALVDGAWGFAASSRLTPDEIDRVTAEAVRIARASARLQRHKVDLGPPEVHVASYHTQVEIDPFSIPLEQKLDLLFQADEAMRAVSGIRITQAHMMCARQQKTFASTEGSFIEQTLVETGAGLVATATDGNEVQQRSFPSSFGGQQCAAGYEVVQNMGLVENAPRIAEEAVALLSARPCPTKVTTVILDSTQTALQIHESCGHPVELDRALGTEASFAGTSFLTPDKLNRFRYGSEIVNITADATIPGALGTFGFDDEGVPAQRTPLVKHGIFVGYLTSRETARRIGLERSNGTMRADGWNHLPLIRMTNINLEPGEWTLEDLIADTEEGIFMAVNRSWSIDDRRLNFQFGTEIAWEIKNGRLGDMLKNATYTGITPRFWASCDAICNRDHWTVWGLPNCGKGQPSQTMAVGHGAAPARFRNVQVGVLKQR